MRISTCYTAKAQSSAEKEGPSQIEGMCKDQTVEKIDGRKRVEMV